MSRLEELKDKFNSLEGRDRKILLTVSLAILLLIIYIFIYKPVSSSIDNMQKKNSENQQLLVWMAQSAASIKNMSGGVNKASKRAGRSLNEVINSTASSTKITISRSQPRDNNQYQIWLDQIGFNELLVWLAVLQNDYGVFVSNINIGTTDKKGYVRVNLTFQDSGS